MKNTINMLKNPENENLQILEFEEKLFVSGI